LTLRSWFSATLRPPQSDKWGDVMAAEEEEEEQEQEQEQEEGQEEGQEDASR
jgi:hypothetical protein